MAQVWEKENKKILDLKLLLYEEHPGWHESMVLSVSHDSAVETVGLFKTAERNPEKRLECETHQDPSQGNHQTTVCGNKTGPLSEDNSGTEPRVHI